MEKVQFYVGLDLEMHKRGRCLKGHWGGGWVVVSSLPTQLAFEDWLVDRNLLVRDISLYYTKYSGPLQNLEAFLHKENAVNMLSIQGHELWVVVPVGCAARLSQTSNLLPTLAPREISKRNGCVPNITFNNLK